MIPFRVEILRTESLSGKGFDDVSARVRAGEVIGLYGLIGAGRSEFVQSVFGRFPWESDSTSIFRSISV